MSTHAYAIFFLNPEQIAAKPGHEESRFFRIRKIFRRISDLHRLPVERNGEVSATRRVASALDGEEASNTPTRKDEGEWDFLYRSIARTAPIHRRP